MVDIGCVWALVYYCLRIVKNNSRTIQIFKGVLLIVIIRFVATKVGLHTIASLADSIMNWGVVAIIIIFQPEIRSILEKIGKTSVFSGISTLTINERENLVNELVKACSEMSKTKTGALISIEQGHSLSDFIKTGTSMNSVVSSELLCSIFQYGTPLHDGAVIIQGVKIACAAAYFPPTTRELPTSYGARHRAAVGISEITDSITIVVSEETGNISIAQNGTLTVMSEASLKEFLLSIVGNQSTAKEKEEQQKETLKEQEAVHGKKPGVFAHYFKGKGRKTKDSSETISYTEKKKKEESVDIIQPETDLHDKLEIEDLAQKQATGLDQLFDNILNEGDKKEEAKPKKKRKKKAAQTKETNASKEENPKKEDGLSTLAHMSQELMEDVVEPETIVLHYESDEEGRDS
jgi:TIGR00159 family protein